MPPQKDAIIMYSARTIKHVNSTLSNTNNNTRFVYEILILMILKDESIKKKRVFGDGIKAVSEIVTLSK